MSKKGKVVFRNLTKQEIAQGKELDIVSGWIGQTVTITKADLGKVILKNSKGESLEISTELLTGMNENDDDVSILSFGTDKYPLGFFSRHNDQD